MPGVDFKLLRTKITMADVLRQLGFVPVSRSGEQLRGPCPVHSSRSLRSRTFSVNLESGRYYCHKCQSQGNPLELWAAVCKLPLYEAALDLCRALGREVPWIEPCSSPESRTEKRHRYSRCPKDLNDSKNVST